MFTLHDVKALAAQRSAAVRAAGADCDNCPFRARKQGPVLSIPAASGNARLVIVHEMPSKRDIDQGRLFSGHYSAQILSILEESGIAPADVAIVPVVACRPGPETSWAEYRTTFLRDNRMRQKADKPPLADPRACCHQRLLSDLLGAPTNMYLTVGALALKTMVELHGLHYGSGKDYAGAITVATLKDQHGAPIVLDDAAVEASQLPRPPDADPKLPRIILASLHPAFAARGKRAYTPIIKADIERAAKICIRGRPDWALGNIYTFSDIDVIEARLKAFVQHQTQVAVDIETDSVDVRSCRVRCVGIGGVIDGEEHIVVVPFRWVDGRDYWATRDLKLRAIAAVREVADKNPLIFHNGAFDTGVMLRVGLMSDYNKRYDDTMLAHHDMDHNDLPHGLGFVATRFCEVPMWKKDVDHKATGNIERDRDLHDYNAIDVTCTLRAFSALSRRIIECGTRMQYDVDVALAPIARDMERLGLCIDEPARGQLSVKLNKVCLKLRKRFVENAGKDINPRSAAQIGTWLFDDLGLVPPLNTKGHEWQEGDSYSTSAAALMQILDKDGDHLPAPVKIALESLLEFKSAEKLRSTYVDNVKVSFSPEFSDLPLAPEVRQEVYNKKGQIEEQVLLPERYGLSRLHPTWKIHIVPTGRWSSSPNCQNWPARAWGKLNLRELVVAPPGHIIVGADFEQIELRIYAVQAQDRWLLKAFRTPGMDPHAMNAAVLFSPDQSDEGLLAFHDQLISWKKSGDKGLMSKVKHLRNIAKRFTYLETYGGAEDKLFSVMSSARDAATGKKDFPNITPHDCSVWHERWHRIHPETRIWQERCGRMQRQMGFVASMIDYRKRFFPGGPDRQNSVPNHTIQGSAAAIMNRGLLRLSEAIPFGKWSKYTGLCLQVHDYAGVYVPESRAEEACAIVKKCLDYKHEDLDFPVDTPLASRSWAEQG